MTMLALPASHSLLESERPEDFSLLIRLLLKLVLRELKKHPQTMLMLTLEYLSDAGQVPPPLEPSWPWLYRKALQLLRSEARAHPGTVMARILDAIFLELQQHAQTLHQDS